MRKLLFSALLVLVIAAGQSTWCEEIPTAPETPAEGSIDVRKATPEEIKKWLRRDSKGYYLDTQILLLGTRWWKKAELREIFGKANENALGDMDWIPKIGYEGVVIKTDVVLPGKKEKLLSLNTMEAPQKELLELTVVELGPAE